MIRARHIKQWRKSAACHKWRSIARKRWPDAIYILGDGPWALQSIGPKGRMLIHLYLTEAEAIRERDKMRNGNSHSWEKRKNNCIIPLNAA